MLRLHEQLLSTVSGLVRRDCNYYNIDTVKMECTWDADRAEWNLPQVTVTKTTLSPVSSNRSMPRKSSSTAALPSTSSSLGTKLIGSSPSTSPRRCQRTVEEMEMERGGSGEELDYFKPKRALELLAEGAQMRGGSTGTGTSVQRGDPHVAGDVLWRRGRLQSLPPPSGPPSHHLSPHSMTQHGTVTQHNVLEAVERKKSKWRSLEPLADPHKQHPPL